MTNVYIPPGQFLQWVFFTTTRPHADSNRFTSARRLQCSPFTLATPERPIREATNWRIQSTFPDLQFYSTAEYAAPVCERSVYAHLLNPELNQACRAITGCLKPTNVENLYLLAGIAPPEIRRSVCERAERTKQGERDQHTSKKTSKVEKMLPYKCSTSSLPSKNCPSQRMEEKTEEGTGRLSQPVRGSSHGA